MPFNNAERHEKCSLLSDAAHLLRDFCAAREREKIESETERERAKSRISKNNRNALSCAAKIQ